MLPDTILTSATAEQSEKDSKTCNIGYPPTTGRQGRRTNQLIYLKDVLGKLSLHENAEPFRFPVDATRPENLDYYDMVKKPMDLQTVTRRLNNNYYMSGQECLQDVHRMFFNFFMYHKPGTDIVRKARELEEVFKASLARMPTPEQELGSASSDTIKSVYMALNAHVAKARAAAADIQRACQVSTASTLPVPPGTVKTEPAEVTWSWRQKSTGSATMAFSTAPTASTGTLPVPPGTVKTEPADVTWSRSQMSTGPATMAFSTVPTASTGTVPMPPGTVKTEPAEVTWSRSQMSTGPATMAFSTVPTASTGTLPVPPGTVKTEPADVTWSRSQMSTGPATMAFSTVPTASTGTLPMPPGTVKTEPADVTWGRSQTSTGPSTMAFSTVPTASTGTLPVPTGTVKTEPVDVTWGRSQTSTGPSTVSFTTVPTASTGTLPVPTGTVKTEPADKTTRPSAWHITSGWYTDPASVATTTSSSRPTAPSATSSLFNVPERKRKLPSFGFDDLADSSQGDKGGNIFQKHGKSSTARSTESDNPAASSRPSDTPPSHRHSLGGDGSKYTHIKRPRVNQAEGTQTSGATGGSLGFDFVSLKTWMSALRNPGVKQEAGSTHHQDPTASGHSHDYDTSTFRRRSTLPPSFRQFRQTQTRQPPWAPYASTSSLGANINAASNGRTDNMTPPSGLRQPKKEIDSDQLQKLMDMGFPKDICKEALLNTENLNQATDFLLDKMKASEAAQSHENICSTSKCSEEDSSEVAGTATATDARVSSSSTKMEDELTCPVCLELFRDPLLLSCSHSICRQCVLDILDSQARTGKQGLECPSCRKSHAVDKDNVDKLLRNLSLANIVSHFQESLSQSQDDKTADRNLNRSVSPGQVELISETCGLCEDSTTKAVWYCEQCCVSYCQRCLDVCHPKRGPLASHKLRKPQKSQTPHTSREQEAVDKQTFCKDHKNEVAVIFCQQCKAVVCLLCVCEGGGKHYKHKIHPLDSALSNIKDNFGVAKNKLERIAVVLSCQNGKLEEVKTGIEEAYTQASKKTQDQCEQLIMDLAQELRNVQQTVVAKLGDSKSAAIDKLNSHVKQNRQHSESVETLLTSCNKLFAEDMQGLLQQADEISSLKQKIRQAIISIRYEKRRFDELVSGRAKQEMEESVPQFHSASKDCLTRMVQILETCQRTNMPSRAAVVPGSSGLQSQTGKAATDTLTNGSTSGDDSTLPSKSQAS